MKGRNSLMSSRTAHAASSRDRCRGQVTIEFALTYVGVILPLTLGLIFTAQVLWIWHSVNEFTRMGASYATTHCWMNDTSNVVNFMQQNVPAMIHQDQFQNGTVPISVTYFGTDPSSGALIPFMCDTDCSSSCVPSTVTVSVTGFQFQTYFTSIGLPPVTLPDFRTSAPMESAGCDPEQGVCQP